MNQSGTVATLSGRYRLEERIGSGGAGEVWRAHDTALARRVAIKLLHPALRDHAPTVERFKREAAAAAGLSHAHVVMIYDVGHDDGHDYLVMEHVDGAPLSEVLQGGPMDPGTVAALGAQVADALASAHDLGLIHRDIKPANVLVSREGVAKVADFGIAKALGDTQTRLTATGTIVGSAAYVAPEQLRDGDIDGRADIYALGLMLHECLTGERPFGGGTAAAVAARRLTDDPPAPSERRSDIPRELDDAIVRATHQDRGQRFASARGFADTLAALTPPDAADRLAEVARRYAPREPASTAVLPRDERYGDADLHVDRTETLRVPGSGDDPTVRVDGDATTIPPREVTAPQPVVRDPSPADRARSRSRDRSTGIAVAVLLVVVAAIAAIAMRGGDPDGGADPQGDAGPYAIVGAMDFDPFGGGSEHRDEVPLAHDGDPATAWTTERYNRANMGGLKPGTGIFFDLGSAARVATVALNLGATVDVQVFAGTTPPQGDPNTWGTLVGAAAGARGELALEVPDDLEAQFFLVWITSVPEGRGAVNEIAFTRA